MNKTQKGFTLIELLVVVAVIGMLATAGLVGLRGAQIRGRDTRRVSDLRTVQTALEVYFNRYGTYPTRTGINQWANLTTDITSGGIGISRIPTDPIFTGNDQYQYSANSGTAPATSYVMRATLEDSGNRSLSEDVDGTVNGIDCGPTSFPESPAYYCVQL